MVIGMLWYDNAPTDTLETKVQRAATYYRNKYGITPTKCFVHPSMVGGDPHDEQHVDGITIKKNRSIMPNHFWMGVEERA